jgi:hypothetical protein
MSREAEGGKSAIGMANLDWRSYTIVPRGVNVLCIEEHFADIHPPSKMKNKKEKMLIV